MRGYTKINLDLDLMRNTAEVIEPDFADGHSLRVQKVLPKLAIGVKVVVCCHIRMAAECCPHVGLCDLPLPILPLKSKMKYI